MNMEQSHVSGWLNVIVETYLGEMNVALSEKIFRALCTPVPWIMMGPRLAVDYLKQLGFDVLDDLVDHDLYDSKSIRSKAQIMPELITATVQDLKKQDFNALQQRCLDAANNNQAVLLALKQRWPQEFADWLPGVVRSLYRAS
jgi:hypothetical protein